MGSGGGVGEGARGGSPYEPGRGLVQEGRPTLVRDNGLGTVEGLRGRLGREGGFHKTNQLGKWGGSKTDSTGWSRIATKEIRKGGSPGKQTLLNLMFAAVLLETARIRGQKSLASREPTLLGTARSSDPG